MRTGIIGAALLLLGVVAVLTGLLPADEAIAVGERTWPILLFVLAITVVTELAAEAGVFSVLAERMARWGRGRALLLWLMVLVLSLASTVFLSLDTTAVLLTPVVVLLARHNSLPVAPFALVTVWIANCGSLLLPVSNLTNLLAEHALGFSDPARFVGLMALPALAAFLVPAIVLMIVFRRDLALRYQPAEAPTPADPVLFWICAVVLVLLLPALVTGIPVWIPAVAAAVVLTIAVLVRNRSVLRFGLIPWQILLFAGGLFLVVEAAHAQGLSAALGRIVGTGDDPLALLRMSGSAALSANLVDNLPAYLALEPVAGSGAGSEPRIAALLVGVNAGPLITPWASLATLLWHARLKSMDVEFSWKRYMLLGLIVVPPTLILATLAIAL